MGKTLANLRFISLVTGSRLGKELSLPLVNQLVQISGSVCFFVMHVLAFAMLINKFNFTGWSRSEMWIMLFTFEIFTYLAFFLFWRGFNYTVRDINSGQFDLILTKPASSRIIGFFRGGSLHNIFCSVAGFVLLLWYVVSFHLPVTVMGIALYVTSLFMSLWILFCLGVAVISLNLRYGRLNGTIGAVFQVQEAYKYPSDAYRQFGPVLWVIFSSLSLLTTFPAASLLSKPIAPRLIILYFGFMVFSGILSRFAWYSGLRHYSSSGS